MNDLKLITKPETKEKRITIKMWRKIVKLIDFKKWQREIDTQSDSGK